MYEDKTPEAIKAEILSDISAADTREGSYTNNLVSPAAVELSKVYDGLNAMIPMFYVDETSGEWIDTQAAKFGITRKAGTKATVALTLVGTDGTVIPAGTAFLSEDSLEYLTDAAATISGGTAQVTATAADVGEEYNAAAGTITGQYSSITGLQSVTNSAAAAGGTDPETDASLVDRYYAYLQKPATSGNVHHYEDWALAVDGVGAVKVTPLANGPGTVDVLIVGPDKQPVDSAIVSACAAYIEDNRPIGAAVTVESAAALTINVTATVTVDSTTTAVTVQTEFAAALDAYLKSIAFVSYALLYNKVAYLLMGIDGVINYSGLQVNGGTADITIAANQVPVLGTVAIS